MYSPLSNVQDLPTRPGDDAQEYSEEISQRLTSRNWIDDGSNNESLEHDDSSTELSGGDIDSFIENSGHMNAFTIVLINETSDNLAAFGSADGLCEKASAWIMKYMDNFLMRVVAVDKRIPVMLQDSFKGASSWSPLFDANTNLAIGSHITSSPLPVLTPSTSYLRSAARRCTSGRRPSSLFSLASGSFKPCTTTLWMSPSARAYLIPSVMLRRTMLVEAPSGLLCPIPTPLLMEKVFSGTSEVLSI